MKHFFRISILFSAIFYQLSSLAANSLSPEKIDSIVIQELERIEKSCRQDPCPKTKNTAIGVIDKNGPTLRYYLDSKSDSNPSSGKYMIGSLTKSFTALVILELVQERKIDLDHPASEYLPKSAVNISLPRFQNQEITVRHLLTHTSGFPPSHEADERFRSLTTIENMYGSLSSIQLESAPGSQFQYTGFNYGLLTAIIENIEKNSLSKVFEERIFSPLGMKETSLEASEKDLIPSFDAKGSPIPSNKLAYMKKTVLAGSAAVKTTPADFAKYVSAQAGLNSSVSSSDKLSKAMVESQDFSFFLMDPQNRGDESHPVSKAISKSTPQFLTEGKFDYVGLGWFGVPKLHRVFHNGNLIGFKARMIIDRQESPVAVFAFSNIDANGKNSIVKPVTDTLINQIVYNSEKIPAAKTN